MCGLTVRQAVEEVAKRWKKDEPNFCNILPESCKRSSSWLGAIHTVHVCWFQSRCPSQAATSTCTALGFGCIGAHDARRDCEGKRVPAVYVYDPACWSPAVQPHPGQDNRQADGGSQLSMLATITLSSTVLCLGRDQCQLPPMVFSPSSVWNHRTN